MQLGDSLEDQVVLQRLQTIATFLKSDIPVNHTKTFVDLLQPQPLQVLELVAYLPDVTPVSQ